MPAARDNPYIAINPVVKQTAEDRIASDILGVIKTGAPLLAGALQVTEQTLREKNQDISTYQQFLGASEEAKRKLGIDKIKDTIDDNESKVQSINLIANYYNKLSQQERIGLVSFANGRSKEELAKMLTENPGIVDPQNLIDYKNDIAKSLAIQDAAQIFDNIQVDRNKIDQPGKTITQHVNDFISSRQFSSEEQKRAYLETLLPTVVNTNENLLKQRWEKQRADIGAGLTDYLEVGFSNMANSKTVTKDDINNVLNAYVAEQRKYFPEVPEKALRAQGFSSLSKVLSSDSAIVDPFKAQEMVDSLVKEVGDRGPAETREWLTLNKQVLKAKTDGITAKFVNDSKVAIDAAKSPFELKNFVNDLTSAYNQGKVKPIAYNELKATIAQKETSFKNLASKNLGEYLTGVETSQGLKDFSSNVDEYYKNGMITQDDYSRLQGKITEKAVAHQYDFQVDDRVNSVKNSQYIAFGDNHYKQIDKYANMRMQTGMSATQTYQWTVDTFGTLTTDQINNLNSLGNSADGTGVKNAEALSIVSNLDKSYVSRLVSQKGGLNGKFATLLAAQQLTGIDSNVIVQQVAGATSETYQTAEQLLTTSKTSGLKPFDQMISDSFDTKILGFIPNWDSKPTQISQGTSESIKQYYKYSYAQLYTQSSGTADPVAIGKAAQENTENFIKNNMSVVKFAGENLLTTRFTSIPNERLTTISPIVDASKDYIADTFKTSKDDLKVDLDNMTTSKDGNSYLVSLKYAGSNMLVATVEIPIKDIKSMESATDFRAMYHEEVNTDKKPMSDFDAEHRAKFLARREVAKKVTKIIGTK